MTLSVSGAAVSLSNSLFTTSNGTLPAVTLDVREAMAIPALRGVNLGGWLVVEEWMTPTLFGAVGGEVDGVSMHFQSVTTGLWISAQQSGVQQVEGGEGDFPFGLAWLCTTCRRRGWRQEGWCMEYGMWNVER